jgi:uncharacterized protein YcaQ
LPGTVEAEHVGAPSAVKIAHSTGSVKEDTVLTTRAKLRDLLLRKQGLFGSRLSAGPEGAVTWVRRQGFLPLELRAHALAPSHDIALFDRISGYQPGDLDLALYDGAQLFEHFLHVPGALPARDHALIYDPERAEASARPGSPGSLVLEYLRTQGPAALKEIQACLRDEHHCDRRDIAHAVQGLFSSGAILVRHREGNQALYDVARRVLPGAGQQVLPVDERLRGLVRRTLQILAPVSRGTWFQVLNAIGSRSKLDLPAIRHEKRRLVGQMIEDGEIVRVQVNDPPEWYFVPASWLAALEQPAEGAAPRLLLLSPLDPVVWDRRRALDLFGFDWHQAGTLRTIRQRRFSANTLSILYGDSLVGRVEPQMSWSSERLVVHGVHLSDDSLLERQHFQISFTRALQELAAFHDARDIEAAGPIPRHLLRQ